MPVAILVMLPSLDGRGVRGDFGVAERDHHQLDEGGPAETQPADGPAYQRGIHYGHGVMAAHPPEHGQQGAEYAGPAIAARGGEADACPAKVEERGQQNEAGNSAERHGGEEGGVPAEVAVPFEVEQQGHAQADDPADVVGVALEVLGPVDERGLQRFLVGHVVLGGKGAEFFQVPLRMHEQRVQQAGQSREIAQGLKHEASGCADGGI